MPEFAHPDNTRDAIHKTLTDLAPALGIMPIDQLAAAIFNATAVAAIRRLLADDNYNMEWGVAYELPSGTGAIITHVDMAHPDERAEDGGYRAARFNLAHSGDVYDAATTGHRLVYRVNSEWLQGPDPSPEEY